MINKLKIGLIILATIIITGNTNAAADTSVTYINELKLQIKLLETQRDLFKTKADNSKAEIKKLRNDLENKKTALSLYDFEENVVLLDELDQKIDLETSTILTARNIEIERYKTILNNAENARDEATKAAADREIKASLDHAKKSLNNFGKASKDYFTTSVNKVKKALGLDN